MKVIFYDGLCPMCNSWVKRIIRWDKLRLFHFAPLEGEFAKTTLEKIFPDYIKENTIIFYDEGIISVRSTAALNIVRQLGLPYSLFSIGFLLPAGVRDAIYRWVANRRYRYGARYESCPLPPPQERSRFL